MTSLTQSQHRNDLRGWGNKTVGGLKIDVLPQPAMEKRALQVFATESRELGRKPCNARRATIVEDVFPTVRWYYRQVTTNMVQSLHVASSRR